MLKSRSISIKRFYQLFIAFTFVFSVQTSNAEIRQLTNGAQFHGSNGVRISPDGLLYVSSTVGSRINILNPDSGKHISSLDQSKGVLGADDLAFDPDGLLYWTAFFTGDVMRLNTEGQAEVVANVGPGVNAITFSAEGRLFVTRVFLADELYEIDPQNIQSPRLVSQGMGGLNAMDFGPDGFLYGPIWFKGEVARINVDSGEIEAVASGLEVPAAVKFSPQGILHVVDQHQGKIFQIDTSNGEMVEIAEPGLGSDNFDFDSNGRMFVSNAHDGGVKVVLPNGKTRSLNQGGLSMPAGITFNADNELVVAASQSLKIIDSQTGKLNNTIHASIGDPTTVATPLTISRFDEQFLVSSWFSNTVQIWDPASQSLSASFPDFLVPLNAIAFNGDIIVAELVAHRVVKRNIASGNTETLLSGIPIPTGMATNGKDLYVADWLTGTLFKILADGNTLLPAQVIVSGLLQPEGMAMDNEGRLLIIETGSKKLLRIDPANPVPEVLADNLDVGLQGVPGYPPSWLLSGIVVDSCGRITISLDVTNSLLRVVPEGVVAGKCKT